MFDGNILKILRIENGLCLSELSRQLLLTGKLKITSMTLSKWERGITEPGYSEAVQLASFFNKDQSIFLSKNITKC